MIFLKSFLVLNTQAADIIVACSRSSVSFQHSTFNHKHTLPLFLYLPLALSPSLSLSLSPLHTDTNIPKCGLTANATTDFLFNVFQPVAQWQKTTFKNMTFLRLVPRRPTIYTGCVQFDSKHFFTGCESTNMKSCVETFDTAALQVASWSLAQTKSQERDHRLFTTWTFMLLISLWNNRLTV